MTNLQNSIGGKADTSTVYTKTATDSKLGLKADAANVYTKTNVNDSLAAHRTTINAKANTAEVYTKTQMDSAKPIINYYSYTETAGYYMVLSSGDNTIATVSFVAPRPGKVIVSGVSQIYYVAAATDMSTRFLVTEKSTSLEDELGFTVYGTTTQFAFYSQSRGFTVTSGSHTFKLIATKGNNTGEQRALNYMMTLIYTPN